MDFDQWATQRITMLAEEMPRLMEPFVEAALEEAERIARAGYSGRILQVRSGDLRATLRRETTTTPDGPQGTLTAGSNRVRYARIHEFGGRAGRRLTVTIPARPILGPAIEEAGRLTAPVIEQRLRYALEGR